MLKYKCPLCKKKESQPIFHHTSCPAFQHKVYTNSSAAKNAQKAEVHLVQCPRCDFVWNEAFDATIMGYNADYQNEQAHSPIFQKYLDKILTIIGQHVSPGERIHEVGCGKAHFLSMLRNAGYRVSGFDPAHEGNDPDVICSYFDESLQIKPGEMIVLRHTLEHVPSPLDFLHSIRKANNSKGKIFIEVPCFEWIRNKKSFWDIFHEHCNYFTKESLTGMFETADAGHIFNGQYMYLVTTLTSLKDRVSPRAKIHPIDPIFKREIERLSHFVKQTGPCLVWGGGAKGVAFCNLTDPAAKNIAAIIDINPRKQGRYISLSAHRIIGPENLKDFPDIPIIIMNENYQNEIMKMLQHMTDTQRRIFTLGDV